ncbi:MAG: ABC transporter ATP-binding protein [Candidatus Methylomirabilia bacterium]
MRIGFGAYRPLKPSFRRQRGALALGILTLLLTNLFTFVSPWIAKRAVDGLQAQITAATLLRYCLLILGAALLQGVFRYWSRLLVIGVSREVEFDLRNLVFSRLLAQAPAFFQRFRTGDLMSRATSDIEAVRMVVGPGIMQLANTVFTFVIAIAMMLSLDPVLTLWSLMPMPAIALVMYLSAQFYHRRFLDVQVQQARLNTVAQENFSGIRVVKTYGLEEPQREVFVAANREYLARNMRLARALGFFHPLVAAVAGFGTLIVLWVGGRRIIAGECTLGTLVAFMALFSLMTWPTIALGWVVSLFQRGAAALGRINEILAAPLAVVDPVDPVDPRVADRGAALEVRRLTFTYPGRTEPALRDVSFAIGAGERVAVVGRTGSGKTTLLSLIPRLWSVADGSVFLDGVDINRLRLERLRSGIGFVPQETFLFSDTLSANIALPEGAEDAAALPEVEAAGSLAQFAGDVEGFPDGWRTLVGERGITLSGGQKQRAAIARALLRRPRLLIFDDALSSVDTETEEKILDRVMTAHPERTVLFVSHRLSTMRRADRILVFDNGALVESGTHEQLMTVGGAYRRLIDQQLLADELEREDL